MKKLPAIVLGLMLLLTGTTQRLMAQDEDVSLQTFYDELSPYGDWIEDSNYGYVWRPDVDQNEFRPYYTNGRWAMTEYGNTWVSNYDWGWAPFHYGRWVTNRYNEWVWIPDTIWGPAWVNWRSGDGYYGWAPLGPSMNVNVNIGYGGFSIPDFWWCFIPQRNIYYSNFPRYYSNRNYGYIHNTTIINNIYVNNRRSYYAGPRREDIRRDTRMDVRVYNINRVSRPDRSGFTNNSVNLYRPTGGRGSNNYNGGKPAPRQVVSGSNLSARGNRSGDNNATRPTTFNPDGSNRGQGSSVRGDRSNPTVGRNQGIGSTRGSNGGVNGRTERTPSDLQSKQQFDRQGRQQSVQQVQQQRQQRSEQRQQADQQQAGQRQQADQERQQQAQQRSERQGRQQSEQQAQQRQQQAQQQNEQSERQSRQQSEQQAQQRQQQAQQQNEQRQQQAQQQRQQAEQRQQQAQQNEQRQQQAQQQRQQAEQRQQQAQQNEQRQQQAQQQRQQADQQRQQQAQPQRTEQAQPQRSTESRGSGRSGRN